MMRKIKKKIFKKISKGCFHIHEYRHLQGKAMFKNYKERKDGIIVKWLVIANKPTSRK